MRKRKQVNFDRTPAVDKAINYLKAKVPGYTTADTCSKAIIAAAKKAGMGK